LGNAEKAGEAPVGTCVWKAVGLIAERLQAPSPLFLETQAPESGTRVWASGRTPASTGIHGNKK